MAIEMVNGYSCANCADVALAKRGVDPTKASSLAEGLAMEAREKTSNALLPEAVSGLTEAERPRAKLDFSRMLDVLV